MQEFSSTQIALPGGLAKMLLDFAPTIPNANLAADGVETDPHITVKFGLHTDDSEDVRKVVAGVLPVKVRFGKTDYFEADDYDVLFVSVESDDLKRLNALLGESLDHTDTHPDYRPHATIAYLQSGAAAAYAGNDVLADQEFEADTLFFSSKARGLIAIPLKGAVVNSNIGARAMKLEHKTYEVAEFKANGEKGEIEAIVSVFSNIDSAKERVRPGFFTKSLAHKLPKGVFMHDWKQPVAKTLEAKELMPGDPTLPMKLRELGGLYIKGQFNLDTQRGKEAFSDIKFGIIDEFSIGYRVLQETYDKTLGVRDLIEGQLFEWSPVLVGMNPDTALLSAKSDDGDEDDKHQGDDKKEDGNKNSIAIREAAKDLRRQIAEAGDGFTPEKLTALKQSLSKLLEASGAADQKGLFAAELADRQMNFWSYVDVLQWSIDRLKWALENSEDFASAPLDYQQELDTILAEFSATLKAHLLPVLSEIAGPETPADEAAEAAEGANGAEYSSFMRARSKQYFDLLTLKAALETDVSLMDHSDKVETAAAEFVSQAELLGELFKSLTERWQKRTDTRTKVGRVLSAANREKLKTLHGQMSEVIQQMGDLLDATEPKSDEGPSVNEFELRHLTLKADQLRGFEAA